MTKTSTERFLDSLLEKIVGFRDSSGQKYFARLEEYDLDTGMLYFSAYDPMVDRRFATHYSHEWAGLRGWSIFQIYDIGEAR